MRGYSMAGLTPELRLPAGRHGSTSMVSAITNQGSVRFSFFEGTIDAERFVVFLMDLIQDAQRKVFLMSTTCACTAPTVSASGLRRTPRRSSCFTCRRTRRTDCQDGRRAA